MCTHTHKTSPAHHHTQKIYQTFYGRLLNEKVFIVESGGCPIWSWMHVVRGFYLPFSFNLSFFFFKILQNIDYFSSFFCFFWYSPFRPFLLLRFSSECMPHYHESYGNSKVLMFYMHLSPVFPVTTRVQSWDIQKYLFLLLQGVAFSKAWS